MSKCHKLDENNELIFLNETINRKTYRMSLVGSPIYYRLNKDVYLVVDDKLEIIKVLEHWINYIYTKGIEAFEKTKLDKKNNTIIKDSLNKNIKFIHKLLLKIFKLDPTIKYHMITSNHKTVRDLIKIYITSEFFGCS
jgi:hypothetical protein